MTEKNPAKHGSASPDPTVLKYGPKVHEAAHMLCEMMIRASDALADEMFQGADVPAIVHVLAAEMASGFWRRIARDENVPREDVAAMRKAGSDCALAHYEGHLQAQKRKQADLFAGLTNRLPDDESES